MLDRTLPGIQNLKHVVVLMMENRSFDHMLGALHSVNPAIDGRFSVDGGKIALRRDDVNLDQLRHSFNVGLTVRAGGLPVFYLLFAWGGNEGNHTTATISPTLLGGSARPSLF